MAKDFIRAGSTVAFTQAEFDGWWTIIPNDAETGTCIQFYAGEDGYSGDSTGLDNLIDVLKQIKKASK